MGLRLQSQALAGARDPGGSYGTEPLGFFGQKLTSGLLREEYSTDLIGAKRWDVYDEMRTGDPHIRKQLRLLTYPMVGALWTVEPATADPTHVEQAKFVESNLLGTGSPSVRMRHGWRQHVYESLTLTLTFGFSLFEPVMRAERYVDGALRLAYDRLPMRHPRSVAKWLTADGQFAGIEQQDRASDDSARGKGRVTIPAARLLRYAFEQEGERYEGNSFLRAMHGVWKGKQHALKIELIDLMKRGVGTPYARLTESAGSKHKDLATNIVKGMRGGALERSYAVVPSQIAELGFVSNDAATKDAMPLLEKLDQAISDAGDTAWSDIGPQNAGARAGMEPLQRFWLIVYEGITSCFVESMQAQLVEPLVDANWSAVTSYPKLRYQSPMLDPRMDVGEFVRSTVQAGLWLPTVEDEKWFRGIAQAPALTAEQEDDHRERMRKGPAPTPAGSPIDSRRNPGGPPPPPAPGVLVPMDRAVPVDQLLTALRPKEMTAEDLAELRDAPPLSKVIEIKRTTQLAGFYREPTRFEARYLALAEAATRWTEFEGRYRAAVADGMAFARRHYVDGLRSGAITAANYTTKSARGKQRLVDRLTPIATDASAWGAEAVTAELERQELSRKLERQRLQIETAGEATAAALDHVSVVIGLDVTQIVQEEQRLFTELVTSLLREGLSLEQVADRLEAAYGGRTDRLATDLGRKSVTEAINRGRDVGMAEAVEADRAERFAVRTEILDEANCGQTGGECLRLDGLKVVWGTQDYERYRPPAFCSGGARCRGQYIVFSRAL